MWWWVPPCTTHVTTSELDHTMVTSWSWKVIGGSWLLLSKSLPRRCLLDVSGPFQQFLWERKNVGLGYLVFAFLFSEHVRDPIRVAGMRISHWEKFQKAKRFWQDHIKKSSLRVSVENDECRWILPSPSASRRIDCSKSSKLSGAAFCSPTP